MVKLVAVGKVIFSISIIAYNISLKGHLGICELNNVTYQGVISQDNREITPFSKFSPYK